MSNSRELSAALGLAMILAAGTFAHAPAAVGAAPPPDVVTPADRAPFDVPPVQRAIAPDPGDVAGASEERGGPVRTRVTLAECSTSTPSTVPVAVTSIG